MLGPQSWVSEIAEARGEMTKKGKTFLKKPLLVSTQFSAVGRDCGYVTGRPQVSGDTFTKKGLGGGAKDHLQHIRSHDCRGLCVRKE